MPLYSTSISDRKRRKPHFYDSRLFIYIFRFFSLASGWFWTFLLFFLGFMSIFSCLAPYFSLASGWFWTFLRFFCALCPFSPAQLRISLWLSDDFGLFYCFSRLYVHSQLLSSVFPLASEWFWTFLLLFSTLCPFSPARFRISLWLPSDFGLFYTFSVLYAHSQLLSSVFPSSFRMILDFFPIFLSFMSIWKSTEVSGLRWIQKSQDCEEYRNLQTAKSTEVSKLRWARKSQNCDEFKSLQTA